MSERKGPDLAEYSFMFVLVGLAVIAGVSSLGRNIGALFPADRIPAPVTHPPVPEVLKQECEHFVQGQLLFQPTAKMTQGVPYVLMARLTRNAAVDITKGLDASHFSIQATDVSCKVSLTLASSEPNAFSIENLPPGRLDYQLLRNDAFTEWDWTVTPLKNGTLHILLYVTPYLYIEGVNESLEQAIPQEPRVITVTPDRLYEAKRLVVDHWAIFSVGLTAIGIPIFIWVWGRVSEALKKSRETKDAAKPKGFLQR